MYDIRTLYPVIRLCSSCRSRSWGSSPLSCIRLFSISQVNKSQRRQWSTPLAETIGKAIETTGQISVAQYMRQCLISPEGGYYMRESRLGEPFGRRGDFITSPEISQVFGELIGLWFVTEWIAQGRRQGGIELIEVGPGRGTLMDDMLRAVKNFQAFASSIDSVCLVEASPSLREKQKQLLCGNSPMEETEAGWQSWSKHRNIPVKWYEDIRFIPNAPEKTPFFIAHEFFDALPIHAFRAVLPLQKLPRTITGLDGKPIEIKPVSSSAVQTHQWRELVVSIAPLPESRNNTQELYSNVSKLPPPDFQLSQSKAPTPSSLVIPESSPRYRALKSVEGAVIEVSPESRLYAADFARRIGGKFPDGPGAPMSSSLESLKPQPSGAALILDYGTLDTIPASTLRGIRAHELVSPFSMAGQTDLSADVDFTALAEAAIDASPGVEVHGPVEQGMFLRTMGILERAQMLAKNAEKNGDETGREAARRIHGAVERLLERGGGGMGKIYKALAIIPENGGHRRPVGFGGQVVL